MSIEEALKVHAKYNRAFNDRLHIWMAAVTPRGSSISCHQRIGAACRDQSLGLTMHCAEAPRDLEIFRDKYACSPMEFCQQAQLVGSKRVLAHMVNLDLEKDIPILVASGTSVAHNPSSNCKLASGIAPVTEMLAAGVNVCLGTDGAPCSNNYDMLQECRMASLLQKGRLRDAAVLPAYEVLLMATINGAKALGIEEGVGSLVIGKKADFVIIDPSNLACCPFDPDQVLAGGLDPVTTVVFSCTAANVSRVVVDGVELVQDGKLTTVDETELQVAARKAINGIRDRARLKNPIRKEYQFV